MTRSAASVDDPVPRRPPVLAAGGMVSASHPAIALAGARVLSSGGNAVDATLAMAAVSWLVLPGQCGVGGDAFAVVRRPGGELSTVAGSGFGPDGGTPEFYRVRGLTAAIPADGALSVAVPGAVAALHTLHSLASRPLQELWEPAAELAAAGVPCTAKTRADITEHRAALLRDAGAAAVFLPQDRIPDVGARLYHPDLAATIRQLARDPAAFYSGSLAERAVAALVEAGAPFSGDEWSAGREAPFEPPITGAYAGRSVHQTPPPTPGWMVLQQAALCDGLVAELGCLSGPAVDLLARAAHAAFADRVRRCGSDSTAWRELLSPEHVAEQRRRLAARTVAATGLVALDGDTTSMVAVDADGTAVSFIHSLAFTFGARITVPGTGVVLNNRLGRGAYLAAGHPNEVRPRRKPLHTLNAWIVTDSDGGLLHVGNTPGGDGQVQWNMQIISHLLDHGLDPSAAVAAPRFTAFPGSDSDVVGRPRELRCESRLGTRTLDWLASHGHRVSVQGPWDGGGSAQVVSVDAGHGCLVGAADPRQEGVTLGV